MLNLDDTTGLDSEEDTITKGYLGFSSIFYAVVFDVLVMGLENKFDQIFS